MVNRNSFELRNFRIVCERANKTTALVRLCATLTEAVELSRRLTLGHLAKLKQHRKEVILQADRPRLVYVERWGVAGWEIVEPSAGGYRFEFLDRVPRRHNCKEQSSESIKVAAGPAVGASNSSLNSNGAAIQLRAGTLVLCKLLERRTRKGGWFAQVIGQTLSGPITNWRELPLSCQPGQEIELKICGVRLATVFVQLAFVPGETGLGSSSSSVKKRH